jgi:hypothetical protein
MHHLLYLHYVGNGEMIHIDSRDGKKKRPQFKAAVSSIKYLDVEKFSSFFTC